MCKHIQRFFNFNYYFSRILYSQYVNERFSVYSIKSMAAKTILPYKKQQYPWLFYYLSILIPQELWRISESNRWPPACKAGALASWANPPFVLNRRLSVNSYQLIDDLYVNLGYPTSKISFQYIIWTFICYMLYAINSFCLSLIA